MRKRCWFSVNVRWDRIGFIVMHAWYKIALNYISKTFPSLYTNNCINMAMLLGIDVYM